MERTMFPGKKRRRLKRSVRLGLFLLTVAVGIVAADLKIRPVVEAFARHQAQVAAARAINDAVEEVLEQQGITYEDLVALRVNEQGDIKAIETKVIEFNLLRTRLTRAIDNRLQARQESAVSVPVGTLTGGTLLSGRGPKITFRVIPLGYVHSELENVFSSAGINQTLHQIMLHISAEVAAVFPGYTISTVTSLDFCVAETVIVGVVPESFAQISGSVVGYGGLLRGE